MDAWSELQTRLARVENPWIARVLADILAPRESKLRVWPAAVTVHHAYPGGLLDHILKVAETCDALGAAYDANRDLLLAGAVLHDIAKLDELTIGETTGYSRDGNLIGHITLGVVAIRESVARIDGFPDDLRAELEHLVVSHHGSRQLGSPVEPMTIEALILSAADDLDAKIDQAHRHMADDEGEGEFTTFHPRLRRAFFKPGGR
jgi:3'-5' exoribonuclease